MRGMRGMSRQDRNERRAERMNGECRRIADWIANPRPLPRRQSCEVEFAGLRCGPEWAFLCTRHSAQSAASPQPATARQFLP